MRTQPMSHNYVDHCHFIVHHIGPLPPTDASTLKGTMKRLSVWAVILSVALCIPPALARKPKTPKMVVQLYGIAESYGTDPMMTVLDAYLILPDGSHALASCVGLACKIEAFVAEKRVKIPCDLLTPTKNMYRECYQSETYYADRKNNDITLNTINGKVTYHIFGSW
jgi:hypothetical protein